MCNVLAFRQGLRHNKRTVGVAGQKAGMDEDKVSSRVLVVEDEEGIQELLRVTLQRNGFDVRCEGSVESAEAVLQTWGPQLLVLDWMLPGKNGLAWCRMLRRREETRKLPIILLTARGEEGDRVHGLESGADDYLAKPFSPRELVARVNALLRRSYGGTAAGRVRLGGLQVDLRAHRVYAGEVQVHLGPTEFRLLRLFVTNPERVFSRDMLLDQIWGRQSFVEERTVDVHIRRLRRGLEHHGYAQIIETVRGEGYRCSALGFQREVVDER
ncbi:phosphate regulon transcriptional regulator PhoB [Acidithiobacillus ferrooxidans]|uniref:phosphate regulon transcriptional regulator PhoB n=1 Tax=Acidithiobacillus ferrooxidans TaxID=920 RepID=UPI001EF319FF|nr:phosphate regulon transcriptional regulator PhoB [Acidithiobacillus ferrooxidans]MCR2828844.1 phosphate regulon transcriptional regulator PhoB [Acidithiobacillus ferrooxidans]